MNLTARVKSIEALSEWKSALTRFVGEAWEVLRSAEQKIRRTEEWLQERSNYWHHKVEQCREEVWQAKRGLQHCRDDENNDCSAEEETLSEAKRCLHEAEDELENVRRWEQRIDEMVAAYRVQSERLGRLLATEMPRADAFLGRTIDALHAYLTGISLPEQAALAESVSPSVGNAVMGYGTWRVTGTPEEKELLLSALTRLSGTQRGRDIAQAIQQRGATVCFGHLPEKEIAKFNEKTNVIFVNKERRHISPNVLAAYLAHEGTHVEWWHRYKQPNSDTEEFAAYKAQVEVWREVKGSEGDTDCDFWDAVFRWGDEEAMWWVKQLPRRSEWQKL